MDNDDVIVISDSDSENSPPKMSRYPSHPPVNSQRVKLDFDKSTNFHDSGLAVFVQSVNKKLDDMRVTIYDEKIL